MNYYALTLRKSVNISTYEQAEKVISLYYKYLNYFSKRNPTAHVIPNLENKPQKNGKFNLHCHSMVKIPTNVEIIIPQIDKGYYVDCKECRSKKAWEVYIAKDEMTQDKILSMFPQRKNEGSPLGEKLAPQILNEKTNDADYSASKYHHVNLFKIKENQDIKKYLIENI